MTVLAQKNRAIFVVGALLAVGAVFACSYQARQASDSVQVSQPLSAPSAVGEGRGVAMDMTASAPPTAFAARGKVSGVVETNAAASQELPQIPATGMIIRNGAVSIRVDSLEVAIDRVRNLAISLGGYIGNIATQMGEYQIRSATLELKIPATRFDSAMTGMPAFGKVEHSSSTAEDVGEEFVDVTARVANAKRLEDRLVRLLTTRTGKLDDVLRVERELARVREEIERYEGRLRFLRTRVATSTIVATVHEKAPLIAAQPGSNVFAVAFINMWRNFVGFLTEGIEFLGVAVPLAALAWVGWIVWKRLRRREEAAAAASSVPPEPSRA